PARGLCRLSIPSCSASTVARHLHSFPTLRSSDLIPALPVYVDSPMASGALQFYAQRLNELDPDMKPAERDVRVFGTARKTRTSRSEEHTSELQSHLNLVCRLVLEKENKDD